ncbi:GntR family transcriptional regulator [Clostridium sp. D2Q-11]|uniref:GntR family transcriptional regulator n=1 Tax=Anaeromonas frigoriresistens TaxID=2683708 RepID=A0A942V368_9FIRM|nr:GntR family transcriptional regulator [Anaeromonas frigoriresistens]MBS4539117.1 GntR family transcriptional regulator [Anaeromonas frigoriresistens]
MDFDNNIPIYVQIIDYIKGNLVKEEINAGEKLMSVREMSEKLKVNPNTVQRAYQELEREEITFTKRGKGTFVTEDNNMLIRLKRELSKEIINSFISNMKELGFNKEEIVSIISEELKGRDHDE